MSAETIGRQEQLLTMLERLLELPVSAIDDTLHQVVQQCTEVLAADKMDIFFLDATLDWHHTWTRRTCRTHEI